MGHFGKKPIRLAWFLVVFPALALNYLGQGALLLVAPGSDLAIRSTSNWALEHLPAGGAVDRGHRDRLAGHHLRHLLDDQAGDRARLSAAHARACTRRTSEIGQIYIPAVNWLQLIVVLLAVVGFGSSDNLASAYGIAVTGDDADDDHPDLLRDPLPLEIQPAAVLCARPAFSCRSTSTFFSANALKIAARRLVPAAARRDPVHHHADLEARPRSWCSQNLQKHAIPLDDFLQSLFSAPPHRGCRAPPSSCAAKATACRMRCCTTCRTTRCCMSASCS